jgi:hypothetical protein
MQTTAALQHKPPATASVTGTLLRPLQPDIITYSRSISPPVTTTQLTPPMNLQLLQAAANSAAMLGSSAGTHLNLLRPLTDRSISDEEIQRAVAAGRSSLVEAGRSPHLAGRSSPYGTVGQLESIFPFPWLQLEPRNNTFIPDTVPAASWNPTSQL